MVTLIGQIYRKKIKAGTPRTWPKTDPAELGKEADKRIDSNEFRQWHTSEWLADPRKENNE